MTPEEARDEVAGERRERAVAILDLLEQEYPDAECALDFSSPLELLVATVLSAQCTDERVNRTTPELFERCPDAEAYAEIPTDELEELVRSTGFFRRKASTLQKLGRALVAEHGGEVPDSMEELVELPGVGRKTANVVLGTAFGKNEGIVVDTHVKRVSRRLALTAEEDPEKIERDLIDLVPREAWTRWSFLLIDHGRALCRARRPQCPECPVHPLCPAAESF